MHQNNRYTRERRLRSDLESSCSSYDKAIKQRVAHCSEAIPDGILYLQPTSNLSWQASTLALLLTDPTGLLLQL